MRPLCFLPQEKKEHGKLIPVSFLPRIDVSLLLADHQPELVNEPHLILRKMNIGKCCLSLAWKESKPDTVSTNVYHS